MQLTPRYEGDPVLRFDPPVADPADPAAPPTPAPGRHPGHVRRRPVGRPVALCGVGVPGRREPPGRRSTPSGPPPITAGRAGTPTRFLVGFDPAVTPAQMVAGAPEVPDEELLARLGGHHRVAGGGPRRPRRRRVGPAGRGTAGPRGHQRGRRPRAVGRLGPRAGHLPAARHRTCRTRPTRWTSRSATPSRLGPALAGHLRKPTRTGAFRVRATRSRRGPGGRGGARGRRPGRRGGRRRPTRGPGDAVGLVESFSLRSGPPELPRRRPGGWSTPWPSRSTRPAQPVVPTGAAGRRTCRCPADRSPPS